MSAAVGYIAVPRRLADNPLLAAPKGHEFSPYQAFLWMVAQARWSDGDGLKRGQFTASIRHMAGVWNWTAARVQRFIEKLKADTASDTAIDTASDTGQLVVTLCNYSVFCQEKKPSDTPTDTARDTPADTNLNKNINNIYPIAKAIGATAPGKPIPETVIEAEIETVEPEIVQDEPAQAEPAAGQPSVPDMTPSQAVWGVYLQEFAFMIGKSAKDAGLRRLVGSWCKSYGEQLVCEVMSEASARQPALLDPTPWIIATLQARKASQNERPRFNQNGNRGQGSAAFIAARRFAEQRAAGYGSD